MVVDINTIPYTAQYFSQESLNSLLRNGQLRALEFPAVWHPAKSGIEKPSETPPFLWLD